MKEILRYSFILFFICVIASGLLATVNFITKPKIIAQARAEEESALKEVLPEAVRFEPVKSNEETLYYKAYDKEDKLLGVAFKTQVRGYSSTIESIAGMSIDGRIIAIKIANQNETPGIGSRVSEDAFIKQFTNRSIDSLKEVQAITGATISSRAVIDSVEKRARQIIELLKDE